jgi:hypothetical protein
MNQTTKYIVLEESKRHIIINKLNFLGYETAPKLKRIKLSDIKYMGLFENRTVTQQNFGLLPSFALFFGRNQTEEKGAFRFFYKFMADNEVYLIPYDHPNHKDHCFSDELLMAVLKGQQKKIFEFDFTEQQQVLMQQAVKEREDYKQIAEFKQLAWTDPIAALEREYSYFHPNREFSGKQEIEKFKKVDDGTFVDNGYR